MTRRLKELRALESDSDPNVDAKARVLYEALSEDLDLLDVRFHILFGGANRSLPSKNLPADWRRRVTAATAHWIRLERLVDALLTHDDVLPVDGKIPPEFAALLETVNGTP